MPIPTDLGLQIVNADIDVLRTTQTGRTCVYVNGANLYFRVGNSEDDDAGNWRDGGDHNFHLEIAYLDVGTGDIKVGYTNDGTTETQETIVTKGNSGIWKLASYDLAATAKTVHTVYADYGLADFALVLSDENYIATVVLIDRDAQADAVWTLDRYHALLIGMLGGFFYGIISIVGIGGTLRWLDATSALVASLSYSAVVPGLLLAQTGGFKFMLNGPLMFTGQHEFPNTAINLVNGNNDDIGIAGTYLYIQGPTAVFNVRGFNATGSGDGRLLIIFNHTSHDMTIVDESGGSAAANRIRTQTGANVTIAGANHGMAMFIYNGTDTRWDLISHNP